MAEKTGRASRFEPLSVLWHLLAAAPALLIFMGLLALALAASTVIPQMPASHAGDPQAWLAMQVGVWAQAGDFLYLLGIFNITGSLWFRALLVLIGLSLLVRTVDSLELAWRVTRREPWRQANLSAWGAHPPRIQMSWSLSLDEAVERLDAFLVARGYLTRPVPALSVRSFVAVRRGLVLWVRPFAYGSLLFLLICMAIADAWGWQGEAWRAREGEVHAIARDESYAVRLDSFSMLPGEGEKPPECSSMITWLYDDVVVGQGLVGDGRTTKQAGITLRQVGYVPMVRMRGWDANDQPLMMETEGDVLSMTGEAEIRFNSATDKPLVLVPNEDLFLMLSFEQGCDAGGPALHISRIGEGGDAQEVLKTLFESGSVSVDGLRFDVALAFSPVLRVDYHPAMVPALIGAALLVIAVVAGWLAPPRLLWIAISEGQECSSMVRLTALPGVSAQPWLSRLAGSAREALHDDA